MIFSHDCYFGRAETYTTMIYAWTTVRCSNVAYKLGDVYLNSINRIYIFVVIVKILNEYCTSQKKKKKRGC